ncbi:uncharacterized protein LOC133860484 [Alnus glutinosa]|uniref:uncharacterized protein LOC133860484 n=1 Tax=Alnus glutinosa TaxID=3517 RepID=UPI002D7969C0|nr:uncharacterized protein LOC133860484 [Alnus glutinosa]
MAKEMTIDLSKITLRPYKISYVDDFLMYGGDDKVTRFIIIVPKSGDDRCRADVGYALAAEYWGQGIAARAVKMAIAQGLKEFPDVVRFQALVELENNASQKVLEKLGFLKEGNHEEVCNTLDIS